MSCECESRLVGTGFGCSPIITNFDKVMIQRLYANDGTTNSIVSTATPSTIDALINHIDPSKRLYVLKDLYNNKKTSRAKETATGNNGIEIKTNRLSNKTYEVTFDGCAESYASMLTDLVSCGEWGFYIVDSVDGLIGGFTDNASLNCYPRPFTKGSWHAMVDETDGVNKAGFVILSFQEATICTDKNFGVFEFDQSVINGLTTTKEIQLLAGTGHTTTTAFVSGEHVIGSSNKKMPFDVTQPAIWYVDGVNSGISAVSYNTTTKVLALTFTPAQASGTVTLQVSGGGYCSNEITVTIP